jgi:hypothetical protein
MCHTERDEKLFRVRSAERIDRHAGKTGKAAQRRGHRAAGKRMLAVMPWDLYKSIMETLEILGDEEMTAALLKGIDEIAAGKRVAWKKAKRELAA